MRGRATTILLAAGITAVLFFGCGGSESPETPEPPSNLTITFGDDDYQVILHWDPTPSTNIEEYRIYFNADLIGSVPAGSLSFAYYPDTFGTFSVTAFIGQSESERTSAELPASIYSEEINLDSRAMGAFRLNNNGEYSWQCRYSIIEYEG
ncbi:fibronectin type III domain-containing protein, partial [bacterium]|nr:fibronectin type III domain-containing protein [bacterium]